MPVIGLPGEKSDLELQIRRAASKSGYVTIGVYGKQQLSYCGYIATLSASGFDRFTGVSHQYGFDLLDTGEDKTDYVKVFGEDEL